MVFRVIMEPGTNPRKLDPGTAGSLFDYKISWWGEEGNIAS